MFSSLLPSLLIWNIAQGNFGGLRPLLILKPALQNRSHGLRLALAQIVESGGGGSPDEAPLVNCQLTEDFQCLL